MTLRVNGHIGFQVVASTHEFPEGGAAVTSMVDHTLISAGWVPHYRSASCACRYLPPQIGDAHCEIPSRVARVPGFAAFRKLLRLFGESQTGRGQFAAWYRKRHGQSTDVSQMNPASSRSIATTVRLMGLPRAVSRRNRRHSRTWASQARSMMALGRPSRRAWISGLTRAGWR
jgi:hypothetical protein